MAQKSEAAASRTHSKAFGAGGEVFRKASYLVATLLCGCVTALAAPPAKVIGSGGAIPKIGGNYDIPASLGVLKGGNLFQTFIQFDLTAGESATFGGTAGLQNIFSRVTGGRSYIDGTIASSMPGVNLYFVNANGITFGRHARLDVGGAFAVTTADVLKFADGGKFDALNPANDSLTSAPLSAYGFLGTQANSIAVDYSQFPAANSDPGLTLAVPAGQTLTLVGGALSLSGGSTGASAATLSAPAGRVEMAAVRKGDLKTDFAPGPKLGTVSLDNVKVSSEGDGSRGLSMRAADLNMFIASARSSGAVDVVATKTANLDAGSEIRTVTNSAARAGNFSIRGGTIKLDGNSTLGSRAQAGATSTARAGNVSVRAGKLVVRNGSTVSSSTFGAGSAGNVNVKADQVFLSGDGAFSSTGIVSNSVRGGGVTGDLGRSGNVNVTAGTLRIQDGSSINGDTFDNGHGGNVNVTAGAISIVGGKAQLKTGIFSDSNSPGAGGDGGDIHVRADTLDIRSAGLISTKTVGAGRGGDTVVQVRDLYIERGDNPAFTGIAADSATNDAPSLPAHFAGPGGNVVVEAQRAQLVDGGQISASTQTTGRGGSVSVKADTLIVTGNRDAGAVYSNITSDSRSGAGAGGPAGDIEVAAKQLLVSDGARISSTSFGLGRAGEVRVQADTALITGGPGSPFTGIAAAAESTNLPGPGGTVRVQFGQVVISGSGAIAANTRGPGTGGDIIMRADYARILNGGEIFADTSATGRGGSVDVTTSVLTINGGGLTDRTGIFSDSSAIGRGGMAGSVRVTADAAQLLAGGSIAAGSSSSGTGGSVVVEAQELMLVGGSSVAASATGRGDAGSVEIHVTEPLEVLGLSSVRTTSAKSNAGTVSITSASDINIEEGSSVTVQALTGNAGRIALQTPHRLLVRYSTLLAEAGLNGGDIFIDPEYIVLDHGIISANAVNVGGNILLVADNFLPSSSPITATGSTAGTVQISAPQLDLSGALAALTAQLVDASLRFQERCAMRLGGEVSSFLVLGRGGVEDSPTDPAIVLSRRKRPVPEGANGER